MSNYFQPAPNGGGSGAGRHGNAPPPDQYRQASRPPPGQMMRPYADMRNGNSHGHSGGPTAGQNNGGHYGGGLPPNGGQAFPYSNLGPPSSYGSMGNGGGGGGGGGGQRMHPRNDNFGPIRGGDPRMMNGANNNFGANADFKYRSLLAPPYGSMAHPGSRGDLQQHQHQQRRSRWDDVGQQQQPRHQQQHQQQQQNMQYQQHHQHHQQQHQNHQGHPGRSYNSNQPMPTSSTYAKVSYMPGNDNSNSGGYNANIKQPSLPVAIPPPPPPPPASYLNTERKRELEASAIVEKKATREEVPKDDKPPLPPPPVSRPPSKPPPDVIDLTDNAVNAMNALCSLEGRWGAGGKRNEQQEGEKSGKSKKRRARKKKKNKGSTNADGSSANKEEPATLVLDNAGDGWIEVEDNSSAEKKRKLEPPGKKGPGLAPDFQDGHFEPLAPVKSGGETDDSSAARSVTLNEMPKSQLVSYAAVLGRALDQRNEGAAEQTDEDGEVLTLEDGDEEMDISDDEEEKKADCCRAGEEVQTSKSEKSGEALAKVFTTQTYDPYTPKKDAPLHSSIDSAIQQPSSSAKHGLELGEKEKRALKLAELRAKAKLARAKLRIAEQKKAREADSAQNRLPPNRTQGRSPRSSPLPPVGHPALASSTPKLRDVTALRDRGSLVISDVARTGPDAQVRFVDSVYDLSSEGDRPIRKDALVQRARIIDLTTTSQAQSLNTNVTQPPAVQLSSDETRKKSESLKQQLHLARLQLEIKKKQLRRKELERNKKEEEALLANRRESEKAELKQSPPPKLPNEEGHGTIQNFDNIDVIQYDDDCLSTEAHKQPSVSSCDDETETVEDASSSHDQARLKLEQLRQRQKELKQRNDIANLRNLIHRQRDLLKAQGQELTESTAQLQSCVDGIRDKQELLDESERRLEELNHRKRIVEGMVMRATEQLIAARRALGERRQRPSS